ncbi:hypothetical protein AX774_g247 [Zancudomyces culisetae]|uniref:Uncharacterized protein n=1 Tax=Zancudomyces culisetae TaxID=1213189 RepID=A0A1R1PZ07_ZANCU|nr:hypothetical protein AX774_g247 [Zancudomyces culisetae]|eukprot:OMH86175.1 hypothetical protein AX774_g247 [Zancudomyces culisetae]
MIAVFRHHVPDESLKDIGRLYSGRRIWILTGNRDNFIDHGNSEHMFTQIGPDAAVFRIFDGCGHSVATEELSSYTESLAAFIRLGSFPV